ncbi:phospholipase A2 inhibitor and Ly6/PLAUR domain-containing protein-like [Cyclopterus lumpus]|uniref:phospholipase A2 inhibitor and Ly6/PLAUR domain-containing protein-like n=1 Tax=Cyclopterus lumpus TaxID=8103 RepID=UPI001486818C|nr:phospholipase A2 inhibitor and Ly6/PLAUR domain-containing protein-like [Cyclopterus lumpus]
MKLGLPLTLMWVLSNADGALECQVSRGSNMCASDEYCATAAIQSNTGTHQSKLCLSSSACEPNNQTFSYNFGSIFTALVHCCKTNNCNSEAVAYRDAQTNNSLQCFTCVNDVCNRTVQCVGEQSRCFKGKVEAHSDTSQVLGCASANLCTLLQLNKKSALVDHISFTSAPECCGTSFCNSAGTVNLSVVPVLLVLLFLIVY